jgi:hypothetical protein
LVAKVNARFQQFLNSDTEHNFPWLRARRFTWRTIPRNTGFISML